MGVRLPAEYQEVEYLESDGYQYINSGIIPNENDVYSFRGTFRDLSDSVLFGERSSGSYQNANQLYLNRNTAHAKSVCLITNTARWDRQDFENNIFFFRGSSLPFYINAKDVAIAGHINNTEWNPTQPIYLLGFNAQGNNAPSISGGRLNYFKINGRCEFISCYRKFDSKPGMYDLISGEFFTNAGTGEFLVGPDVIDSISPWLVARRRLLMRKPLLDTSPKIAYENARIIAGGNIAEDQDCVVTALYPYSNPSDSTYTLCYYGTQGNMALYAADRRYVDYWLIPAVDTPKTRAVLYKNSRTSFAAFTLRKDMLDDCFAYVTNTGQILFAGKNSIYYGHRNINELN